MTGPRQRNEILRENAAGYARVALANIDREFPSGIRHTMMVPGDFPGRPSARNPVFYGSYDWHSCVEMHWLLIRLLRVAADVIPAQQIRTRLDRQFGAGPLAAEAAFVAGPDSPGSYGWGWALALAHQVAGLDDPAAERWSAALAPLAEAAATRLVAWLSKATYPVRHGLHPNSAFALSRSLPYARDRAAAGDQRLSDAMTSAVDRWFRGDSEYPAAWEPSGTDFLSPALTEAELMAQMLPAGEFGGWLSAFLPGIAEGQPTAIFEPVAVSDSTDGQVAHLHGLNASRAWCWRRIAESLPAGDDRTSQAMAAADRHADAALPHVIGDHYAVEHWLAAYAVLFLT